MSSPNVHAAWHSQPPLWEGVLDWEEPDADDLGPRPTDTPIRLSWWAMEAVQADVDLASPASAVLPIEPARAYGVAIETRCFVQSIEPQRCVPSALEVRMNLEFIGETEGPNSVLLGPTIVAIWPRPAAPAKCEIVRRHNLGGKLAIEFGPAKTGVEANSGQDQSFTCLVPREVPFISSPGSQRQVITSVRATKQEPSIEGFHYGGLWIASDHPHLLRLAVEVIVKADYKAFGLWTRNVPLKTFRPDRPGPFGLCAHEPRPA
jgi:hypothetical protein